MESNYEKIALEAQRVTGMGKGFFLTQEKGVFYTGRVREILSKEDRITLLPKSCFLVTGKEFMETRYAEGWYFDEGNSGSGYINKTPPDRPGASFLMSYREGLIKLFKDLDTLKSVINQKFPDLILVSFPQGF